MDTPFNFEDQFDRGDESDYIKGKNAFESSRFAQEAAEHPDKKIMALFEAADNMLDEGGDFSEDDLTVKLRRQFLDMLLDQPVAQEEISDIDSRTQRELEIYISIITDQDSVFYVEDKEVEYSSPIDIEDSEGIEPPYEDIRHLYDDMRVAFGRSFRTKLNPLDIIPSRIFLNQNGQIHSAEFDLLVDREKMSRRFKDVFRESDIFQLNYDRYLKKRTYNRFTVSGIITDISSANEFEATIPLDHRI